MDSPRPGGSRSSTVDSAGPESPVSGGNAREPVRYHGRESHRPVDPSRHLRTPPGRAASPGRAGPRPGVFDGGLRRLREKLEEEARQPLRIRHGPRIAPRGPTDADEPAPVFRVASGSVSRSGGDAGGGPPLRAPQAPVSRHRPPRRSSRGSPGPARHGTSERVAVDAGNPIAGARVLIGPAVRRARSWSGRTDYRAFFPAGEWLVEPGRPVTVRPGATTLIDLPIEEVRTVDLRATVRGLPPGRRHWDPDHPARRVDPPRRRRFPFVGRLAGDAARTERPLPGPGCSDRRCEDAGACVETEIERQTFPTLLDAIAVRPGRAVELGPARPRLVYPLRPRGAAGIDPRSPPRPSPSVRSLSGRRSSQGCSSGHESRSATMLCFIDVSAGSERKRGRASAQRARAVSPRGRRHAESSPT